MSADPKTCEHDIYYYLAVNEAGWRCAHCKFAPGEPPGFSPQLDRDELRSKVDGILLEMHNSNLIYISNSSMGEGLAAHVEDVCRIKSRYDQQSIALFILETTSPGHSKYWKKVSEGVLTGHDPRTRCGILGEVVGGLPGISVPCGKLATVISGGSGVCDEHWKTKGTPF